MERKYIVKLEKKGRRWFKCTIAGIDNGIKHRLLIDYTTVLMEAGHAYIIFAKEETHTANKFEKRIDIVADSFEEISIEEYDDLNIGMKFDKVLSLYEDMKYCNIDAYDRLVKLSMCDSNRLEKAERLHNRYKNTKILVEVYKYKQHMKSTVLYKNKNVALVELDKYCNLAIEQALSLSGDALMEECKIVLDVYLDSFKKVLDESSIEQKAFTIDIKTPCLSESDNERLKKKKDKLRAIREKKIIESYITYAGEGIDRGELDTVFPCNREVYFKYLEARESIDLTEYTGYTDFFAYKDAEGDYILKLNLPIFLITSLLNKGCLATKQYTSTKKMFVVLDMYRVVHDSLLYDINILNKYTPDDQVVLKQIRCNGIESLKIRDKKMYEGDLFYLVSNAKSSGIETLVVTKGFTLNLGLNFDDRENLTVLLEELFKVKEGFERVPNTFYLYKKREYKYQIQDHPYTYDVCKLLDKCGRVYHSIYLKEAIKENKVQINGDVISFGKPVDITLRKDLVLHGQVLPHGKGYIFCNGRVFFKGELILENKGYGSINLTTGDHLKYKLKHLELKPLVDEKVEVKEYKAFLVKENGKFVATKVPRTKHHRIFPNRYIKISGECLRWGYLGETFKDSCIIESHHFKPIELDFKGYLIEVEIPKIRAYC